MYGMHPETAHQLAVDHMADTQRCAARRRQQRRSPLRMRHWLGTVFVRGARRRGATMTLMAGRVSSPRFVGRAHEHGRVLDAYGAAADDERGATVLVAGEAGVG